MDKGKNRENIQNLMSKIALVVSKLNKNISESDALSLKNEDVTIKYYGESGTLKVGPESTYVIPKGFVVASLYETNENKYKDKLKLQGLDSSTFLFIIKKDGNIDVIKENYKSSIIPKDADYLNENFVSKSDTHSSESYTTRYMTNISLDNYHELNFNNTTYTRYRSDSNVKEFYSKRQEIKLKADENNKENRKLKDDLSIARWMISNEVHNLEDKKKNIK